MKRKYIYTSIVAIGLFMVAESSVRYSSQPPENYTGAEGSTCAQCHGNLNTGGGAVTTNGLPAAFNPGEQYNFSVSIAHAATRGRWGFSITARDANNQPVGAFSSTNANAKPNGTDLSHFNAVLQTGTSYTYGDLKWTAPSNPTTAQRTVKFYYVGNAANGDFGSSGDYIYSGTLSSALLANQAPTVAVTEPAPGAGIPAGKPITVKATATDADGSITKVEFFLVSAGTATKLGEDLVSPYELTGNDVEPGIYRVVAKAMDDDSAVGISDTANITVTGCTPAGSIAVYGYTNIPGTLISNLTSNPKYPNNPDITAQLSSFEYGPNVTDSYGGRVRGYICAPQTGNYTFYLASDEQSELYLSTDDNPANSRRIAFLTTSVGFRSWLSNPSQRSAPIRLIKGARYYVETLHKEGTGTDHLSVGWVMPNGIQEGPIPGNRLSPFTSTSGQLFASAMEWALMAPNALNIPNASTGLQLTIISNPGNGSLAFFTQSEDNQPIDIILTDIAGRVIERKQHAAANTTIWLGKQNKAKGVYILTVTQGTKHQRLKINL